MNLTHKWTLNNHLKWLEIGNQIGEGSRRETRMVITYGDREARRVLRLSMDIYQRYLSLVICWKPGTKKI